MTQIRAAAHSKSTALPQEPVLHLAARQCRHTERGLPVLRLLLNCPRTDRELTNSGGMTALEALSAEPPGPGEDAEAAQARLAQARAWLEGSNAEAAQARLAQARAWLEGST